MNCQACQQVWAPSYGKGFDDDRNTYNWSAPGISSTTIVVDLLPFAPCRLTEVGAFHRLSKRLVNSRLPKSEQNL